MFLQTSEPAPDIEDPMPGPVERSVSVDRPAPWGCTVPADEALLADRPMDLSTSLYVELHRAVPLDLVSEVVDAVLCEQRRTGRHGGAEGAAVDARSRLERLLRARRNAARPRAARNREVQTR